MLAKKFRAMPFVVLLLATLAACGPGGITGSKATPTPLPAVVNYEAAVFTVEQGAIVSEKELQGEITPSKQDELFFRASGFISRVVVKAGDVVKKGDVLAEMQVDDLLNQLQQAQIDLEVSQSNLAKQKTQHEYDIAKAQADVYQNQKRVELAQMDVENSYGASQERAQINLDMAKKNLQLAQENLDLVSQDNDPYQEQAVKRNELSVQRLQGLLEERQVLAPYDCIILRSNIRPGQQVDAFFSAFIVGDPSELVVRAQYDFDLATTLSKTTEARLRLNPSDKQDKGQPINFIPNFTPTSITDQSQVKNSANMTSQFFYFSLPANITEAQSQVGRQVNVVVVVGRKENALLLPPAAIREYRGLYFVIVQDGDRRRRVEINEIGLKSTDRWEVIGDLRPGDQVLGP